MYMQLTEEEYMERLDGVAAALRYIICVFPCCPTSCYQSTCQQMTKQHTLVSLLLLCDSLKITVKLDYCFQAVYGPQHCNDTGTDCTQQ